MNNVNVMIFAGLFFCGLHAMDVAIKMTAPSSKNKQVITSASQVDYILGRISTLENLVRKQAGVDKLAESLSESIPLQKTGSKGKGYESVAATTSQKKSSSVSSYSDDDIMHVIRKVNPVLSQFGEEHNIAVLDLVKYATLLQEYHIDPTAMAELIKKAYNCTEIGPTGHEVKGYEDMQKNNPDQYFSLMLRVFKELNDQAKGVQKPSPLGSAHMDFLNSKIMDQQDTIYKGKWGFVIHGVVTLLIAAGWLIQSHVNSGGAVPAFNGTVV